MSYLVFDFPENFCYISDEHTVKKNFVCKLFANLKNDRILRT